MIDTAHWHEENTRFLSASVGWVRSLLEQRAAQQEGAASAGDTKGDARAFWRRKAKELPALESARREALLPPGPADEGADTAKAADAATALPALVSLARRLALTPFEQNIVLLCVAMELDTSLGALCARAQGDPTRPYPTFALALALFPDPAWEALSPERPLRHWRVVEINQPSGAPLTTSQLRADEWITNYVKGLTYLDDRLAPLISPLPPPQGPMPESQSRATQAILDRLRAVAPGQSPRIVQLMGADGASKRLIAGFVCRSIGLTPYRLPASAAPTSAPDLESFARLWQRQTMLSPVALYAEAPDGEGEGTPHRAALDRLLARASGVTFLDTRDAWPSLNAPVSVDVAKPTRAEQKSAWVTDAGAPDELAAALAGQFDLNLDDIRDIARTTRAITAMREKPQADLLWEACLAAARPRLDTMAARIEPRATWDELVLPASETALLRQIADQVGQRSRVYQDWGFDRKMSRGLGISALFSGASGTGKTMAAEVIANHLRLNLYRIDLSAVVSKYIGETEKNLRRLFDGAEAGGAILFFDEADALFGKRSEVKDSHDRYANIEINYLLQRMESYGGLAILATNMKSLLDPAFLRRLRFVVNFPFPGTVERKAIWQNMFPKETPVADIDFDRLAKLNLTGGHISLVALNAAFVAAKQCGAVTMPIVLDAARTEFRKLERPIHEPDFRWPPVRVA
jgi:ATPase family associated with various cellular activities (AAA)